MSAAHARRTSAGRRLAGHLGPLAVAAVGLSVFMGTVSSYAAQGPVGLGTADSFAVLAGSGITNTGATTIAGDVGTFPTPTETGFGSVTMTGTNHAGDAVTQGAKNDLIAAYNDAAGRKPVTNVPVELGGTTLLAGVYTSPTFGLTGTLTLDAKGNSNAEFIFQAGSTVVTASDSRVLLLNGADPCHVVWQVGSSATFNTRTQFVGDVLAHTSISALTGATFQGRLLARDGAVTLDHNTIIKASCVPPATTTTTAITPPTTTVTVPPTTTVTFPPTTTSSVPSSTTLPVTPTTTVGLTPTTISVVAPMTATTIAVVAGGGGGGPTPGGPTPGGPAPGATPSAAPGPVPGSPATTLALRTPVVVAGAPPAQTPSTTPTPTTLAFTGSHTFGLVVTALGLLVFGGVAVRTGRRDRKTAAAPRG